MNVYLDARKMKRRRVDDEKPAEEPTRTNYECQLSVVRLEKEPSEHSVHGANRIVKYPIRFSRIISIERNSYGALFFLDILREIWSLMNIYSLDCDDTKARSRLRIVDHRGRCHVLLQ